MDSLANYLVTARSFPEDGYKTVEEVRKRYEKDPAMFESLWQDLFKDEKSHSVSEFKKYLEEKVLFIQFERYNSQFETNPLPFTMDLRVYPLDSRLSKVACLKVVEHEIQTMA